MKLAVDIGTSYTSACIVNPKGEAQSVEVATGVSEFGGKYSMPTAVLLGEDGELLLGQSAVNSRRKRPACYKDNFKRYLGQSVPVMLGEQSFQVEELYTQILLHIRDCVKKLSEESVTELCLTYPATYENNRKELLKKAAADAGFSNVRLLDEPSAAAMCYLKDGFIKEGETLLVYDFGGGTFDVSIIRYMNGKFAVEKTGGLSGCGGSDMDREITKDIMECLKKEESFPKYVSREERKLRLQAQIEKMAVKGKHQLTNEKEFEEWFELGDDDCEYRITQERFNELVAGQISQTVTECRHVLQEAGLGIEKLSKILMVGGTSRIPLVREMVTKMAGDVSVLYAPDLELAVAQGALYHLTEKLKTETESAGMEEEQESSRTEKVQKETVEDKEPEDGEAVASSSEIDSDKKRKIKELCIKARSTNSLFGCNQTVAKTVFPVDSQETFLTMIVLEGFGQRRETLAITEQGIYFQHFSLKDWIYVSYEKLTTTEKIRTDGDEIYADNEILMRSHGEKEELVRLFQGIHAIVRGEDVTEQKGRLSESSVSKEPVEDKEPVESETVSSWEAYYAERGRAAAFEEQKKEEAQSKKNAQWNKRIKENIKNISKKMLEEYSKYREPLDVKDWIVEKLGVPDQEVYLTYDGKENGIFAIAEKGIYYYRYNMKYTSYENYTSYEKLAKKTKVDGEFLGPFVYGDGEILACCVDDSSSGYGSVLLDLFKDIHAMVKEEQGFSDLRTLTEHVAKRVREQRETFSLSEKKDFKLPYSTVSDILNFYGFYNELGFYSFPEMTAVICYSYYIKFAKNIEEDLKCDIGVIQNHFKKILKSFRVSDVEYKKRKRGLLGRAFETIDNVLYGIYEIDDGYYYDPISGYQEKAIKEIQNILVPQLEQALRDVISSSDQG